MTTHDDYLAEILKQPNPVIPTGIFLLERPLVVPPGVYLKGSGMGNTTIGLTPSEGEDPRWAVIGLSNGSKVSDLSIDSQLACTNGIVADGIKDFLFYRVRVRCQLSHCYWAWVHNCENGTVDSCQIMGMAVDPDNTIGQEGIEVFGGINITVQNNYVTGCGRAGINAYQDLNSVLQGCKFYDNEVESSSFGIFLCAGAGCRITDTHVRGNQVHKCGTDLKVAGAAGSIINVLFEKNSYDSFEVNTEKALSSKVLIKR